MVFDIPKDYFLDEVRDGFLVPSMIKKAWAASIMDYKVLEEICDKLGLHIFFMYGSLIAIIRHAGSIPWDDDIDSMMLHDDFEKLKAFLDEGKGPENYWMNDYSKMGNGNLVRKWMDNREAVKPVERWDDSFGFPFINNVDVMILDYLPDGEEAMQYYRDVIDLIQYLKDFADVIEMGVESYNKEEFVYSLDLLERLLHERYDEEKDGKLSVWVWKKLDEFEAKYGPRDGKYVASVAHYLTRGNGRFPKEDYQEFLDMPYEFTTVKVPVGYERTLRDYFGDYMTPQLEWDGHVYPFYRGLEGALLDKYDYELLRYHYKEDVVKEVLDSKESKIGYTDVLKNAIGLFNEAHEYVSRGLSDYSCLDSDAINSILEVLGSCQDLAVNLGNMAESRLADKNDIERIVKWLEDYCEFVFHIYCYLSGEDTSISIGLDEVREKFSDIENKLEEETDRELKEKVKVLFLCLRSADWHSLHTIWEAAVSDEDTDVKVIAVPYLIKTYKGEVDKDNMIIEDEGYPDEVTLTPYDGYDIQSEHPDIVIYQNAYDEFSDAMTVHPYFYTSNLRKYAEKMVFIPPFVLREVTDRDERSKYTIGCYINNPGLVYADMAVVQSDGMKDVYTTVLNEMVARDVKLFNEKWISPDGEISPGDYMDKQEVDEKYSEYVPDDPRIKKMLQWEHKVTSVGTALTDWDERSNIVLMDDADGFMYKKDGSHSTGNTYDELIKIPSEWINRLKKEDGSFRKILLFCISASVAYEYGTKAFDKASRVIRMIDDEHEDDLVVLFFNDRNYRQALRKSNSKAWAACQKFIEMMKNSRHIFDDSQDAKRAAKICDACYGDGSYVMNLCREYGRPVMIESPEISIAG